ncbi:hypothetical protein [Microbacterium hibisci]|uniref:hypothetical protein n=1 Tax=Microbacterium hibisci TaxID=2036000 RepID=UPI00194486E2|nr:hypothetical protein [Microbacterium hibisci]
MGPMEEITPTPSNVAEWRSTVSEVESALLSYPARADNMWLRNYPNGSCSIVSFTVGSVLLQRQAQPWRLLSKFSGRHSHTWLVGGTDGAAQASIDATIHQFPELATGPFVGSGPSPAERLFEGYAGTSVAVNQVPQWWHHGETLDVYEWVFPRLGILTTTAGIV